jgi:aspartokinase
METIAVYWEPKVKTYGFNALNNLILFEFNYPEEKIFELGKTLSNLYFQGIKSKFMILQKQPDRMSLVVCLSESDGRDFQTFLEDHLSLRPDRRICPVGVLFFHGPHFGDRYGIADAAFSPLLEAGIKIISSDCSSSSVFLVMAQDDVSRAQEALRKTFDLPQ